MNTGKFAHFRPALSPTSASSRDDQQGTSEFLKKLVFQTRTCTGLGLKESVIFFGASFHIDIEA